MYGFFYSLVWMVFLVVILNFLFGPLHLAVIVALAILCSALGSALQAIINAGKPPN